MHCHWLAVFKKVSFRSKCESCGWPQLEVTFGYHKTAAEVNNTLTFISQLQRLPMDRPWSAIFRKVNHVGVNMHFLDGLH